VNRVLRKMFGPKTDEVTEKWKRLGNKELYDLCSSLLINRVKKIKKNRIGGTCSMYSG